MSSEAPVGPDQDLDRCSGGVPAPSLCIGLPVRNGEQFLAETLDAILGQTYRDFELIISDNASTDGTEALARSYVESDERVSYVRHVRNIGASANFDSVWRRCRSPFFKWLAADDLCCPDFLERCIRVLETDPSVALVYPQAAFMGSDSMVKHGFRDVVRTPQTWAADAYGRSRQIVDVLLQDGSAANVMVFGVIRSDVLATVRPIGNYFGADLPLVAELVRSGGVVEIPETLSFLRRHDRSSSSYSRSPSATAQQEFYDPSVRGALRLQWNLRRRYPELLRVMATAPVGIIRRIGLVEAVFAAIARRLRWRVRYELDRRRGKEPAAPAWPGGPVHWRSVCDDPSGAR